MESRRLLDLARCPTAERFLFAVILLLFLSWFSPLGFTQNSLHDEDRLARIGRLFEEERWGEIVAEVESAPARGAALEYYYGSALAQLGRLSEARAAFLEGRLRQPADKRFPIELGGVAFKQ